MSTAPTLPPTPIHPESHTYSWTAREVHAIQEYATAHAAALAQRVEELEREVERLRADAERYRT